MNGKWDVMFQTPMVTYSPIFISCFKCFCVVWLLEVLIRYVFISFSSYSDIRDFSNTQEHTSIFYFLYQIIKHATLCCWISRKKQTHVNALKIFEELIVLKEKKILPTRYIRCVSHLYNKLYLNTYNWRSLSQLLFNHVNKTIHFLK